ncbi:7846_t:CDS:2 [Racocetra persica]|uniref:7846_t:CDS:1 n=1 Tax=Racocetra persica TaxID=160502 RepID=A0ACA9KEX4_9GLOM|nr:7846_t:CDS:2 [Racocetra persica]
MSNIYKFIIIVASLPIHDKIEQELKEQNTGIVKIKFPVKELDDLNVREKIHNTFNTERIGFDLFIKWRKRNDSCKPQTICVVENRDFRPDIALPTGLNLFHDNPNPGINTTNATSQSMCPTSILYVCHWDSNNNKIWYQIDWNHYITLRCGLTIDFNVILIELV